MPGEWDGFAKPDDIHEFLKASQILIWLCTSPEASCKAGFFL